MTYGAFTPRDFPAFDGDGESRTPSQTVLCALALAASTAVGLWMLYGRPAVPTPRVEPPAAVLAALVMPPLRGVTPPVATRDARLLDPTFLAGFTPVPFAQSAPLEATFVRPREDDMPDLADATPSLAPTLEPTAVPEPQIVPPLPVVSELLPEAPLPEAPLPKPRPADLTPAIPRPLSGGRRMALQSAGDAPAAVPADHRSFFDKLFRPATPPGPVLAYAAPEDGGLGQADRLGRPLAYDHWTAVYVIATHTVYLPDGTQLEAHSGLGARLDDPRGVTERMRGATPPNVYDLAPREQLFHGVRALRLNPADPNGTYGRGGLLAHTYMLGPRGDSNGCVVFRNYKAFLQAYDSGVVRRLAVVARMN